MSAENIHPNDKFTGRELTLTRVFNAPRELVFKAWSEREHLANWYAPNNAEITVYKFNFEVGGIFLHSISNDTGFECVCKGIYKEIIASEKIVYTLCFADKEGNSVNGPNDTSHESWPETTVTITLEEVGENKTKLTLHQTVDEAWAKQTGAYPSWLQMLDKLDSELSKSLELNN